MVSFAAGRHSLVVTIRGYFTCGAQASHYGGFSGEHKFSSAAGSIAAAHGLSCSIACGILLDQGFEPVSPALAA